MTKLFSITNPPKLIDDLEDPFVNHALITACCELYYKYGMYLALTPAMLATVRHINFNKNKNTCIEKNTDGRIKRTKHRVKNHRIKNHRKKKRIQKE